MMADDNEGSKSRQVAVIIAERASDTERLALGVWAQELLAIRASSAPASTKTKQAIAATIKAKTVWPLMKIAGKHLKEIGWSNRTGTQRALLGGVATGVALFGSQTAGIAALGGAVAVPLWIVFGAGAMFANYLVRELAAYATKGSADISYSVLDAERVDGEDRPKSSGKDS
jgi:hypothetical protein